MLYEWINTKSEDVDGDKVNANDGVYAESDKAVRDSEAAKRDCKLNHHRLKPVGLGWLLKQPKVVRPRSYRSSFVLLYLDF